MRLVARAVVSLSGGLISTVAVAWTCSAFSPLPAAVKPFASRSWPSPPPRTWRGPPSIVRSGAGFGIRVTNAFGAGSQITDAVSTTMVEVASGWPALAFRTTWTQEHYAGTPRNQFWSSPPTSSFGDIALSSLPSPRYLPVTPLWPGFAANLAILSVPAFLVMHCTERWSTAKRRSRSLCQTCSHPLAGLKRCPECGSSA